MEERNQKPLALLLALVLILSLAACGNENDSPGDPEDPGEPEDPPEIPDWLSETDLAKIISINASTAESTGKCGDNLAWYYSDNTLVIRGTGDMECYTDGGVQQNRLWPDGIRMIYIEDGVTSVCDFAFSTLTDLSAVYMPDSVRSIGNSAFSALRNLAEIRLSKNLVEIGSYAFYGTSLTSVDIPDSVTEIGKSAFFGNDFTSATIPASVILIPN